MDRAGRVCETCRLPAAPRRSPIDVNLLRRNQDKPPIAHDCNRVAEQLVLPQRIPHAPLDRAPTTHVNRLQTQFARAAIALP